MQTLDSFLTKHTELLFISSGEPCTLQAIQTAAGCLGLGAGNDDPHKTSPSHCGVF